MIKERAWPTKAMYIFIAVALAMSLMITGVFTGKASANPGMSEWTRVDTPTTDGWVLAPESNIIDFAVGDGGEVAYAIVDSYYGLPGDYFLLKSENGAATWTDITDALQDVADTATIGSIVAVATDGVDADFVAVALVVNGLVRVYISDDGGATFEDAGQVIDVITFGTVYELEVSPEVAGVRDIAIGGTNGAAVLFRSTVTGTSASAWEDTTDVAAYPGWLAGSAVVDIKFAPSWAADKTVLVATIAGPSLMLQFGSWGTSEGWNADSILGIDAVTVVTGVGFPFSNALTAGITLPLDYAGRNLDKRYVWVNVNYNDLTLGPVGKIFRVKNRSVLEVNQQIEDLPLLTNVDYVGYIAEGKAIVGVLGSGDPRVNGGLAAPCAGVQVYRNTQITNMDICCLPWESACKPPTGTYGMAAFFVGEDKAYAVALGPVQSFYDEGAWSVTFDGGDTWNQLSLIDTYIHYFSDTAVSPDCNKTWLVSVNDVYGSECDSVWLHADDLPEAEEYSGYWLRVWCGLLEGDDWDGYLGYEAGMLRLNPEETTGDTVYLFDYDTSNVYWNELEGLACWERGSASVDEIVDLAVLDAETIYAVDYDGTVAMSDDFAIGWAEPVDTEVEEGYTIAVHGDYVLVGGGDGDVAYSDDGGETFVLIEETPTFDGYVTVAFDTYFDTNKVIYAAVGWAGDDADNGVYRWIIGESESWMDLKAEPLESQLAVNDGDLIDERVEVNFTGIVVDRPGNPFTSADNGGVIYASYFGSLYNTVTNTTAWFTGAARSLERMVTVCTTCLTWDFLWQGLTVDEEGFEAWPDALKICGCLTPDTNTNLFAIDAWNDYDMEENLAGSVWTFEDCYAKKAPEPTSPADGAVIPADPCSCYSAAFTLTWDGLCDACYYEIQFALDEDFTMLVGVNGLTPDELRYQVTGDNPSFSVMGGPDGGLSCETTYYWRVRASKAVTEQVIHSWWSSGSFSIAPSVGAALITLVAPTPGTTDVARTNVGFSWDLLAAANKYNWVLSTNPDLTSPVATKTGLTTAATSYTGTALAYDTTYYWQVTAFEDDAMISRSAIGTFRTVPETVTPPVEKAVTPFWVWVVIAIGAILVIVVIVLIFRTRRV